MDMEEQKEKTREPLNVVRERCMSASVTLINKFCNRFLNISLAVVVSSGSLNKSSKTLP